MYGEQDKEQNSGLSEKLAQLRQFKGDAIRHEKTIIRSEHKLKAKHQQLDVPSAADSLGEPWVNISDTTRDLRKLRILCMTW